MSRARGALTASRAVRVGLGLVIVAGTIAVAVGLGQGSPPRNLPLSAAAQAREVAAMRDAPAAVRRGRTLFDAHGCDACHTLAAGGFGGRLGPRLDVQPPGTSAAGILAKIVSPPHSIPGFEPGLMPQDYGTRLPISDLRSIAGFIHYAASAAAR